MQEQLKNMRLRQVDESIKPWRALMDQPPPRGGWVRSIRQALGMSAAQLGTRLGLSRQGVADLERREVGHTVTLAALEKAAEAMDAKLVYAIVPRETLETTRRAQARRRAELQLRRIAHSMRLEAQAVSGEEYRTQLEENERALLRDWSRQIWDMEGPSTRKK